MRLPFIQVTQDAWRLARMLAPLLDIKRREALGLIVDLWAWGLDLGPPEEAPTGVLRHERATAMLAGALEWSGPLQDLLAALVAVGLVESMEDGIRVRGLDRYAPAFQKAKGRSMAAKCAADARWDADRMRRASEADASPMPPDAKTQTQTQTHKKQKHGAADAPLVLEEEDLADQPPPPTRRVGKKRGSLKDGRALATKPVQEVVSSGFRALQEELVQDFSDYLGGKYLWMGAKDTEALKRLMAIAAPAAIVMRWRAGLRATGWNQVTTVAQLWAKWNDIGRVVPPEPEPAKAPEQPDTPAGKLWSEALAKLRTDAPYAAEQLGKMLRPISIRTDADGPLLPLVLEASDEHQKAWAHLHYDDLLARVVGPFDIVVPGAAAEASP
jgi:hypothetical protein